MKNKSFFIGVLLSFFFTFLSFGKQSDPILMTVGDFDVPLSEFEYMLNKNNSISTIEKKSVDEYLEMFENYILKVVEAKKLQIDTIPEIREELKSYYERFSKPYMTVQEAEDAAYQEAFQWMKEKVDVSHILVRIENEYDTIEAYNKISKIKERLSNGEDFEALAIEVSEDPSVAKNKGNLGFVFAFSTVYPFEKAAYNTEVGKISDIVRTRFGYHILKVKDKKPTYGKVLLADIYKAPKSEENDGKSAIDSVYEKLKQGADFKELVKEETENVMSIEKGGEIGWFKEGELIPEINDIVKEFKKIGDFSKPVQSPNGWHILFLADKKDTLLFEEEKPYIEQRFRNMRDGRYNKGEQVYYEQIKKDYNYKLNEENLVPFYDAIVKADGKIDSLFFNELQGLKKEPFSYANCNCIDMYFVVKGVDKELFSFAGKNYSQADFIEYLNKNGHSRIANPKAKIDEKVEAFAKQEILEYEMMEGLKQKHPEYDMLMNEFEGATLCYEISKDEVWDKANKDKEGLEAYYNQHKKEYVWNSPRFKGYTVQAKNDSIAEVVKKALNKLSPDSLATKIKEINSSEKGSLVLINWVSNAAGDNKLVDKYVFKTGDFSPKEEYPVVFVKGKIQQKPKDYMDVRGPLTADYQDYLEEQWVKALREKYPIVINEKVLSSFKEENK